MTAVNGQEFQTTVNPFEQLNSATAITDIKGNENQTADNRTHAAAGYDYRLKGLGSRIFNLR